MVQSNVKGSEYLQERINVFLSKELKKLNELSEEEFNEIKDTCRKKLLKPMNNIYEQYIEYHYEIISEEYIFNRRELIKNSLDDYTLDNMLSDTKKYIVPENMSVIRVNGN